MGTQDNDSKAHPGKLRAECGRPGVHFQGPVVWCQQCYDRLRLGEVPRVCEPWDSDPTPVGERYEALFHAAQAIWRNGITDENKIMPTLAFAARSFELQNLQTLRGRIASATVDDAEWADLQDTFRRAFSTCELVGVVDGVPLIYSRPFKVMAHTYPATGLIEKITIEVYRRSARGKAIGKWYDTLLSRHGVSYEGREGGVGWQALPGCLQLVVQPRAPAALNALLEGRIVVNAEKQKSPFPHPEVIASMCETLVGSVSEKKGNTGFAFILGGRARGRAFKPGLLIPAVVAWYVGGHGRAIRQHDLKPSVARILNKKLIHPCGKVPFNEKGWDSGDYRWEFIERVSQPILRIDDEIRGGYFGPLGYIFPK